MKMCAGRTVRVWDVETGENILTFAGHGGEVYGVAFGGSRVASASPDGTARIWDVDDVGDRPGAGAGER